MIVVHKFPLKWDTSIQYAIPEGAELLCAVHQPLSNEIVVYIRLDPDAPKIRTADFTTVGTGHECPSDGKFLGTIILHQGALMVHIFGRIL